MTLPPPPTRDLTPPRAAAVETRARDTAVRGLAAPGLLGPLPPSPRRADAPPGLLPPSGGQPLNRTVQSRAEARLGVDLSGVYIHSGAGASQRAVELGADAYALGDDVVFGAGRFDPDTPRGDALLMHELAHVAQTRTAAAAPQPLFERPTPGGIGAAPPREPFMTGEGPGPESGHVLFERNSAELDPGDLATITALFRDQTRRLWVDVYGYASQEGAADYNANLSAHRGVAVRRAIEPLMPAGSVMDVHAHGETGSFETIEENRRVGIRVREAPASLLGWRPGTTPGPFLLDPTLQLELPTIPGMEPTSPAPGSAGPVVQPTTPIMPTPLVPPTLAPWRVPPVGPGMIFTMPVPGPLIDFTEMSRSARARGQLLDPRDAQAGQAMFLRFYDFYSVLGPWASRKLAQSTVDSAYDNRQANENPNSMDRAAREDEIRGTSAHTKDIDLLEIPWVRDRLPRWW